MYFPFRGSGLLGIKNQIYVYIVFKFVLKKTLFGGYVGEKDIYTISPTQIKNLTSRQVYYKAIMLFFYEQYPQFLLNQDPAEPLLPVPERLW